MTATTTSADPSAVAAYRRALAVNGVSATLQRLTGEAPSVVVAASATVAAAVRTVTPDGTSTAEAGLTASAVGAIAQADRIVILLADDLAAASFPAPVMRGDLVTLPDSGEQLNVIRVDPYKRAFAGAIELYVAGIS